MKQLTVSDWNEMASPFHLCVIPFERKELEEKYRLIFFEYEEEGLGEMCACIVEVKGIHYRLYSPIFQTPDNHLMVQIRSYEADSRVALDVLMEELEFNSTDLDWVAEALGPARWILTRLDDNDNEIEMFRFLENESARWVQKKYTEKGHKQSYYVKKISDLKVSGRK